MSADFREGQKEKERKRERGGEGGGNKNNNKNNNKEGKKWEETMGRAVFERDRVSSGLSLYGSSRRVSHPPPRTSDPAGLDRSCEFPAGRLTRIINRDP